MIGNLPASPYTAWLHAVFDTLRIIFRYFTSLFRGALQPLLLLHSSLPYSKIGSSQSNNCKATLGGNTPILKYFKHGLSGLSFDMSVCTTKDISVTFASWLKYDTQRFVISGVTITWEQESLENYTIVISFIVKMWTWLWVMVSKRGRKKGDTVCPHCGPFFPVTRSWWHVTLENKGGLTLK